MTQNQLAYWRDQETRRTNLANEAIKESDVTEKVRHNKADEALTERFKKWENTTKDSMALEKTLNDFVFTPLTKFIGGLFS